MKYFSVFLIFNFYFFAVCEHKFEFNLKFLVNRFKKNVNTKELTDQNNLKLNNSISDKLLIKNLNLLIKSNNLVENKLNQLKKLNETIEINKNESAKINKNEVEVNKKNEKLLIHTDEIREKNHTISIKDSNQTDDDKKPKYKNEGKIFNYTKEGINLNYTNKGKISNYTNKYLKHINETKHSNYFNKYQINDSKDLNNINVSKDESKDYVNKFKKLNLKNENQFINILNKVTNDSIENKINETNKQKDKTIELNKTNETSFFINKEKNFILQNSSDSKLISNKLKDENNFKITNSSILIELSYDKKNFSKFISNKSITNLNILKNEIENQLNPTDINQNSFNKNDYFNNTEKNSTNLIVLNFINSFELFQILSKINQMNYLILRMMYTQFYLAFEYSINLNNQILKPYFSLAKNQIDEKINQFANLKNLQNYFQITFESFINDLFSQKCNLINYLFIPAIENKTTFFFSNKTRELIDNFSRWQSLIQDFSGNLSSVFNNFSKIKLELCGQKMLCSLGRAKYEAFREERRSSKTRIIQFLNNIFHMPIMEKRLKRNFLEARQYGESGGDCGTFNTNCHNVIENFDILYSLVKQFID